MRPAHGRGRSATPPMARSKAAGDIRGLAVKRAATSVKGPPPGDAIWGNVARAALENQRRPVLLIDEQGTVRFGNKALVSLLGWTAKDLVGRSFWDVFGCQQPLSVPGGMFVEAFANTLASPLRCITRNGEALALVVEATTVARPPHHWLLVTVLDATPELPALPPLNGQAMYYEVTMSSKGEFGHLVHIWSDSPLLGLHTDHRCYRRLYGRDSPCPECPAIGLSRERPDATSIVARAGGSLTFDVIRARLTNRDSAEVSVFPVTEELLGQLLQKKISTAVIRGGLSEREQSVLNLLLLGRTLDSIAVALKISARTVKYHQRNIQDKLGAESRFDLIRLLL